MVSMANRPTVDRAQITECTKGEEQLTRALGSGVLADRECFATGPFDSLVSHVVDGNLRRMPGVVNLQDGAWRSLLLP